MHLEQNPTHLTFKDNQIEQEFKSQYDHGLQPSLRRSVGGSLITWALGILLIYTAFPELFWSLAPVILITTYPYFFFVLYTTYHDKFTPHYQWMGAASNSIAGLLIIYCFHSLPYAEFYTLINLILILSFIAYIGLRIPYVIVTSLSYMLVYQIDVILNSSLEPPYILTLLFLANMAEFFTIWMGYAAEKASRNLFVKNKIIAAQKDAIEQEQEKSERLLMNILPESVAERLKNGEKIIADKFPQSSVLFADIVGFTVLSDNLPPETIVMLLNDIFSRFDNLVERYNLEKIKTIGDAYMVVGGLPLPQAEHATNIAQFALSMLTEIAEFNQIHNQNLNIRIGLHAGPVVAGIIGTRKFSYDVWGDTVNIASRMESQGKPGHIQLSEPMYHLLKDTYHLEKRGPIDIKGKGQMTTYFLPPQNQ